MLCAGPIVWSVIRAAGEPTFRITKPFRKLLGAAISALLFLSGCELVGVGVMAVSGPACGKFGIPPVLDKNKVNILDWDRIDESIAALQEYEHAHIPDIMAALGFLYARKAVTLSDDPAHNERAVRFFTGAALCGYGPAVSYLGGFYSEGLFGLDRDLELGTCLTTVYEIYGHERSLIPGRVWACGLRIESVRQ